MRLFIVFTTSSVIRMYLVPESRKKKLAIFKAGNGLTYEGYHNWAPLGGGQ